MGNEFTIPQTLIVGEKAAFGELERQTASVVNEIEAVSDAGSASIGIFTGSASIGSYNFGVTSTGVDASANIEYDHSTKQMRFRLDGTIVGIPGPTELTIDASGGTTVTTITESMVVGEDLTVNDDLTVDDDLTVSGLATITETVIVGGGAAFGDIARLPASIANEIEAVNDTDTATIGIFSSSDAGKFGSYRFGTGVVANSAEIRYRHDLTQMRLVIGGTSELSIDASGGTTVTTITADLIVSGDLTVSGTTTTIDTTNLDITDNIITLNDGELGAGVGGGSGAAGIVVDRGSETDAGWFFNDAEGWWGPTGPSGIAGEGGATQTIGNVAAIDPTDATDEILTINGIGSIKLPSGTTGERPTGVNGMVRYSSTFNNLEGYINGNWEQLLNTGSSVTISGDLTMDVGAQIFIDDGTVSDPGLAFSDDGNTGIYSGAGDSNFVGIVAGGSELLRVGPTEIDAFADLDMNNNVLFGVLDPVSGTQVGDRDFNDTRYVEIAGDTMTGTLAMSGASADITLAGGSIIGPAVPVAGDEVGDRDFNDARYLLEANNLSDLTNAATARTNLGLTGGGGGDIWVEKAGDNMTSNLEITDIGKALTLIRTGGSGSVASFAVDANANGTEICIAFNADDSVNAVVTYGEICVEIVDNTAGSLDAKMEFKLQEAGGLATLATLRQNPEPEGGGLMEVTATAALYSDLAERYTADMDLEPGTVVVFGGEAEITMSSLMEDTAIAGVISTAPAFRMNSEAGDDQTHPYVALKGRVPCKVTGPIKKGDLLVTATLHGHAMSVGKRAKAYTAFARALENFSGGTGVIEVAII